jgi:hypothetical protein
LTLFSAAGRLLATDQSHKQSRFRVLRIERISKQKCITSLPYIIDATSFLFFTYKRELPSGISEELAGGWKSYQILRHGYTFTENLEMAVLLVV